MIPYSRQDVDQSDIDAVIAVLRSDFLTQGPAVPKFEAAVGRFCNVSHAIAMNSATSALHLACLALDVGKGDRVWTSPITFVASANCALYCGASIDFVDIDQHTYNMSTEYLEDKLKSSAKNNTLPKVVIPVHFSGQPCDMKKIHELSMQYGFKILEDASHAIGSTYFGEPVGNCKFSDITVFSFHPVKIITTGEGGMAVTNNAELANKMESLRSHGITRDPAKMTQAPDGPWYYQQIDLGFNYRMTDIQAALGYSQLKRLNDYVLKRINLAKWFDDALKGLPLVIPFRAKKRTSSHHLYVIKLKLDKIKKSRLQVFKELRASGIGVNLHYIPIYLQPYYKNMSFVSGAYPEADRYYSSALSLPLYPSLCKADQLKVVDRLRSVLG
jgi:UDP-4-amino-4,6-dideoxy-N-acetyl-beta-L-altrosamine transaminase